MNEAILIETGSTGRVAYARIGPNEDLVLGIEKLCLESGFKNAFVRGAVGSLTDACLGTSEGKYLHVTGPAVELTNLTGEVRATEDGSVRAILSGVVADTDGEVYGGPFIAGANPVCVTLEVTLEEWLPMV